MDLSFSFNGGLSAAPIVGAIQPDGKILVGGTFSLINQGRPQSGLARLNPDGDLDTSFASGVLSVGGSISAIALQPDGRVVVGGRFTSIGGTARRDLARLNPDGSIDLSFVSSVSGSPSLRQVLLTAEGRLLLVDGSTSLQRLNPDGSADPLWRFTPIRIAAGSGTSVNLVTCTVERIALFPDGRIAAVVMTPLIPPAVVNPIGPPQPPSQFSVLHSLASNGAGQGNIFLGGVVANFPRELRVMPDSSILVASTSGYLLHIAPSNPANIYSYRPVADASLGPATCVDISADGRVWVGGSFSAVTDRSGPVFSGVPGVNVPRRTIVRLNPDLSVDSFDPGLGLTSANGNSVAPGFILALPDGRAIVGGEFVRIDSVARPQVARLKAQSPSAINAPDILDLDYQAPRDGESYVVTARVTGSPPFFSLAATSTTRRPGAHPLRLRERDPNLSA